MPNPDDPSEGALKRLDSQLEAFEAGRARKGSGLSATDQRGMAAGYRFLAEVIGGVLGGLGLGWFFDQLAHTAPLGLIGGMLIGTGASIFVAVRGAMRTANKTSEQAGQTPAPPDDDEDD
jgi:ATP synthase protein I